jgi:hypothetical protein
MEFRLLQLEGKHQFGRSENERTRELGVDDLGDNPRWMRL